jgi:phenylacetate-coenzyme A ligase PaaK-like adenylate-forming protein
MTAYENKIFNIQSRIDFEKTSLELFQIHFKHNVIYKDYCTSLKINPLKVNKIEDIPFLPIQFFKSHDVRLKLENSDNYEKITFTSSGTTGFETSKHHVNNIEVYKKSFRKGFEKFYPSYKNAIIIGLLPSYLDREGSSLIYMVNDLINHSEQKESCFSKKLTPELKKLLSEDDRPKILIGVTFALLELAEEGLELKNTTVIETGGMKGMRKEMVREELHEILKMGFNTEHISSEYGMTELLSQAYMNSYNVFESPEWMNFRIRNSTDPLTHFKNGKGALNVIDLANIYSCPFIATDDLAEVIDSNKAKILGRLDHSQIRGCNLISF